MNEKSWLSTRYRVIIHFYIWVKQLNINKITCQKKKIDIKYIQLLRVVLNVSWKQHMPNNETMWELTKDYRHKEFQFSLFDFK